MAQRPHLSGVIIHWRNTQYHKLFTPEDTAIVFIGQQPQMTFGVASADRGPLINNTTLLARVAKEFNVPAVFPSPTPP